MPTYRIISELDTSAEHREPQGACLQRGGASITREPVSFSNDLH